VVVRQRVRPLSYAHIVIRNVMTESNVRKNSSSLAFSLKVEDGWPPVAVENVPFEKTDTGCRILVPPIFVKGISVGDIIEIIKTENREIKTWEHIKKSNRTTIWLRRMRDSKKLEFVLSELRDLGCHTVYLESLGSFSVDVPSKVTIESVDVALGKLDKRSTAVAFPSFRHQES